MSNVEFELTYAEGGYVDDAHGHLSSKGLYTTNANGEIRVPVVGTVVVKEVKTLPSHIIDEATRIQTVTVNPADTQTLVVYNEPLCSLTLTKKDAITGKPVPNTEFTLKDGDGNLIGRYTTGADGTVTVTGLTPNSTVVVVESRVPPKIVKAERRIAVLDERLEMWAQYEKYKPIRQKLDKVKPGKQEKYQQEHEAELAAFDTAADFLKRLKASGEKITPKAWRTEAVKLTAQKDFDYQRMRDMRDEIKAVENLRKAAARLAHEGQHQQRETER